MGINAEYMGSADPILVTMKLLFAFTLCALLAASSGQLTADGVKQQLQDLLQKLKDLGISNLQDAANQALAAGKDALAQLQDANPFGKRSFLPEADKVAEIYDKIKDTIETNVDKAKELYGQAVDKLKDLVQQAGNLDVAGGIQSLNDKLAAIKDKINNVIASHSAATRAIPAKITFGVASAF